MVAVVLSRDEGLGAACAAELGSPGAPAAVVADPAALDAHLADLEVLVVVARHDLPGRPTDDADADDVTWCAEALARVLDPLAARGGGRVVLVVPTPGLGDAPTPAAGARTGALVGMARAAARSVAASGVTVNVVRTGVLASPALESAADEDPAVADAVGRAADLAPLRGTADAAEVAGAVAWLASHDAAYVTGIVLPLDSGLGIGLGL